MMNYLRSPNLGPTLGPIQNPLMYGTTLYCLGGIALRPLDSKSRSTLVFHDLHHKTTRVQNSKFCVYRGLQPLKKIYFLGPPWGLGHRQSLLVVLARAGRWQQSAELWREGAWSGFRARSEAAWAPVGFVLSGV